MNFVEHNLTHIATEATATAATTIAEFSKYESALSLCSYFLSFFDMTEWEGEQEDLMIHSFQ